MPPIIFPTSSYPGARPQESAGRLINAIAEPLGDGAPNKAKIIRAPGVTASFATSSETIFRGISRELVGNVYVAYSGKLKRFGSAGGAMTNVGNLAGTGYVGFARNNKTPTPDFVAVADGDGAFSFTSGSVASFADADLPQPNDVCYGLGFFFFTIGDGRIFATDSEAVTVNALNFTTASGKPDTLLRCVFWGDQLYALGTNSIEVYGRPINATAFPLTAIVTIPYGIAGKRCVTGFEDGMDVGICVIAGNNQVFALNGYTPSRISQPDIERQLAAVTDKSLIAMSSFVAGGHRCIKITGPAFTWVYDFVTQTWHERQSYLKLFWRARDATFAFNRWFCGDSDSGNVGEILETTFTDFGQPMVWQAESAPGQSFPEQIAVVSAYINFVPGTGVATGADPIQTNPRVNISWSRDGGTNWGDPVIRRLGRQAESDVTVTVNRIGQAFRHGVRFRLVVSDPVYVGLMGGGMTAGLRKA